MATNRTFTMIKPDATGAGNTGKIIDRIIGAGFRLGIPFSVPFGDRAF